MDALAFRLLRAYTSIRAQSIGEIRPQGTIALLRRFEAVSAGTACEYRAMNGAIKRLRLTFGDVSPN
jgi:hypothetical protein